jgi:hypothetical protein
MLSRRVAGRGCCSVTSWGSTRGRRFSSLSKMCCVMTPHCVHRHARSHGAVGTVRSTTCPLRSPQWSDAKPSSMRRCRCSSTRIHDCSPSPVPAESGRRGLRWPWPSVRSCRCRMECVGLTWRMSATPRSYRWWSPPPWASVSARGLNRSRPPRRTYEIGTCYWCWTT